MCARFYYYKNFQTVRTRTSTRSTLLLFKVFILDVLKHTMSLFIEPSEPSDSSESFESFEPSETSKELAEDAMRVLRIPGIKFTCDEKIKLCKNLSEEGSQSGFKHFNNLLFDTFCNNEQLKPCLSEIIKDTKDFNTIEPNLRKFGYESLDGF